MTAFDVTELQRAAQALQKGQFRAAGPRPTEHGDWHPKRPVVVVSGAHRHAGTTTVALALAHANPGGAHLIEAGPMHASGLAAASSAELGSSAPGWRSAGRGDVLIERSTERPHDPSDVPPPAVQSDKPLTVLDTGWDAFELEHAHGWIPAALRHQRALIVTTATAPGLRALSLAIHAHPDAHAAVIGPPVKRWPRQLRTAAASRALDQLRESGHLHTFGLDRDLQVNGLTPAPLPPHLVETATTILGRLAAEHTERESA